MVRVPLVRWRTVERGAWPAWAMRGVRRAVLLLVLLLATGCAGGEEAGPGSAGSTAASSAGSTAGPAASNSASAEVTVVPQWLGGSVLRVYGTANVPEVSVTLKAQDQTLATARAQVQNGRYDVRLELPATTVVDLDLIIADPRTNQILRQQSVTREF